MGRPKIKIDFNILENLCGIQCTQEEIVSVLGVTVETIDARCREVYGLTFSEYMAQKKGKGKASLRREQWKKALAGDKTLLIWLGKQELGQADKQEFGDPGDFKIQLELKDSKNDTKEPMEN